MQSIFTGLDKVTKELRDSLISKESKLEKDLEDGDFIRFEKELKECVDEFYKSLITSALNEKLATVEMQEKAKEIGASKNLTVRKTTVEVILMTGQKTRICSYYSSRKQNYTKKKAGRKKKRGPNGQGRHLLLDYFGFLSKASPGCYSYLALLTLLCPSYDLALEVMKEQGIHLDGKTVRRIVLELGKRSKKYRVLLNGGKSENLAGKKVIISVDGGRTRIRKLKKGTDNQEGKYKKFDTPWKEPKVLVIQEIGADGQISKHSLPIYDTVLGSAVAIFDLLKQYLSALNLKAANLVLFIGDGAKWIWKRTKKLFKDLGLQRGQYIEAIDYYHAVQHLYKVVAQIPAKNLKEHKETTLINDLKELLWKGDISSLVKRVKALGKGNLLKINSLLNYFAKQPNLFNYKYLKEQKMPIGSGIIESAIRRIINLRFKSPSSFWLPKNVEPLMYLRGVLLAGRWKNFIRIFANLSL